MKDLTPFHNNGEFLLYQTEDGRTRVECRFAEETLWLTQALMAELFQVSVATVNEHLKTLISDAEIAPEATIRKFLIVRQEGERTVSRFAVTGLTAAELIATRAGRAWPNMGLTSWKGPGVARSDVTVAKNYLAEPEIAELNRVVVMWLDFAEDQALRRKQVFLRDWQNKLDEFLRFNERRVLPDAGRVSKKTADAKALAEYEGFEAQRRAERERAGEALYVADAMKSLEQAARALESPARKPRAKKPTSEAKTGVMRRAREPKRA